MLVFIIILCNVLSIDSQNDDNINSIDIELQYFICFVFLSYKCLFNF